MEREGGGERKREGERVGRWGGRVGGEREGMEGGG